MNIIFFECLKTKQVNKLNLKIYLKIYLIIIMIIIGLHQVLLQIMINPTTVVNGLGITLDESFDNACYNALNLIKLLCSR